MNVLWGSSICTLWDLLRLPEEVRIHILTILGGTPTEEVENSTLTNLRFVLSGKDPQEVWMNENDVIEPTQILEEWPQDEIDSRANTLAPIFIEIYMMKDLSSMSIEDALESILSFINIHNAHPPVSIFLQASNRIRIILASKRQHIQAPQFWYTGSNTINLSHYYYRFDRWYKENKASIDNQYGESREVFYSFMRSLETTFNP